VKLLLDECLDWRLGRELPGHAVKTVQEMGWAGIKNGRLLTLAQSEFQVLVTGDRNRQRERSGRRDAFHGARDGRAPHHCADSVWLITRPSPPWLLTTDAR
jgi:Domain of unknown function (DUF5615)